MVRRGELGSEFSGANERHERAPPSCGGSWSSSDAMRGRELVRRALVRENEMSTGQERLTCVAEEGECWTIVKIVRKHSKDETKKSRRCVLGRPRRS